MKRREFIKKSIIAGAALGSSSLFAKQKSDKSTLTILHTNDTHSRLDPFPEGSGYRSNMGGVSRRANLVNILRKKNPNSLLIDAGDVFQGTPYFNFYEGRLEYETMSMIGYDYGTLGNHDFDLGIEKLLKAMDFLNFKMISSNYKSEIPKFKKFVLENEVIEKDGVKIGLFGLGVSFKGLVSSESHIGVEELNRYEVAKKQIDYLKNEKKVDFVILISHIGVEDDEKLAKKISGIDLIIGGHSHTQLDKPLVVNNTLILQAASSGVFLGKLDLNFENKQLLSYSYELIPVKENTKI
jgi:5'-nucleotidase